MPGPVADPFASGAERASLRAARNRRSPQTAVLALSLHEHRSVVSTARMQSAEGGAHATQECVFVLKSFGCEIASLS